MNPDMIYLFILLAFILIFNFIAFTLSAPRYKGPVSDHFDGKRFINPGNIKAKGLTDVIHWMATRKPGSWENRMNSGYGIKPLATSDSLRVTFINHTTFLIQVNKVNILTDPVWSRRVSPFSFAGPKRKRLPGINFTDLPKIDVVILSHNHYDHLDIHTVKELARIHQCRFIVPLGVKTFLELEKIERVEELDWWKTSSEINGIGFQSVPAQHFSGRGGFDRDATLWCGYVIHAPLDKIYFAGDTGYNTHTFKRIGQELGPFQLSLIPIGAYKPSWFMSPIHCSPEEAVLIHKDVQSSLSIATHFGTFPLADDGYEDPINDLEKALLQYGVERNEFIIPKEGIPIDLK